MHRLALASLVLLAAACGAAPPPATSSTPPAPITEPGPPPAAALDLTTLGQPCATDGTCAAGRCVTYHGIAGPRGPAFTSCEVTCAGGKGCPDGTTCVTVADGPGAVCRPPS